MPMVDTMSIFGIVYPKDILTENGLLFVSFTIRTILACLPGLPFRFIHKLYKLIAIEWLISVDRT